MATTNQSCSACYALQRKLEEEARSSRQRRSRKPISTRASLTAKQYDALVRLLHTFGEHLASCIAVLVRKGQEKESPAIARARASSWSTRRKSFRSPPWARTRIEKARDLLLDPHRRVGEVAFEVGFQSLSQFNRAFKKVAGQSPSDSRAALAVA